MSWPCELFFPPGAEPSFGPRGRKIRLVTGEQYCITGISLMSDPQIVYGVLLFLKSTGLAD